MHLIAALAAMGWFLAEWGSSSTGRTVPAIMLVGSTFVYVAPALVVVWEGRFRRFEDELREEDLRGEESWGHMSNAVRRVTAVRYLIVAMPVVLISAAYLFADDFLAEHLRLPASGVEFGIGLVILQLGGFAAGWAVYCALVTVVLAAAATRHSADFAPYAGTPSNAVRALGEFCFSTALMYGAAAALLIPGLCAAVWAADGVPEVALIGVVLLALLMTVALLAVPAALLSRRADEDRARYLDQLSHQIDELGEAASNPSVHFDEAQYVRLRALLEMRSHVVGHAVRNSSVELVKRVPAAVLLPTASVAASWLSLVST